MKKGILILLPMLLVGGSILFYREFYQLNYVENFHLNGENRKEEFVIYPDTTINNEQFKFCLKGSIKGKATISALAVYKSKKGLTESTSIVDLNLENNSAIDTTFRLPYYGSKKGDKVIIKYQSVSVQQVDLIIKAGIFGLPFEHILNRFL